MASTTVRTTYALDQESVERLESLARQWNVSKSEALRRVIRAADLRASAADRLEALDALQSSLQVSNPKARSWIREVRQERTRSGKRSTSRQ